MLLALSFRTTDDAGVAAMMERRNRMLQYALMFFVIALVAALLGVQGVAGLSAEIGYVLVSVAVVFLLVAFLSGSAPLPRP